MARIIRLRRNHKQGLGDLGTDLAFICKSKIQRIKDRKGVIIPYLSFILFNLLVQIYFFHLHLV